MIEKTLAEVSRNTKSEKTKAGLQNLDSGDARHYREDHGAGTLKEFKGKVTALRPWVGEGMVIGECLLCKSTLAFELPEGQS